MTGNSYVIVGSWTFQQGEKGITVFRYDPATGEIHPIKHYDGEITVGQQYFDSKRNVLYAVVEVDGRPGTAGGGGFIRVYSLDPTTGELTFMNERCVLMTKPSYFWLDASGDYALVSAHTGRNGVTKVVFHPDGTLTSCVVYEDVGAALLRVNADGSLGEVCDVALYRDLTPAKGQVHAHLHSMKSSPDGEIYFSCDKGLDRIYTYKIDRERGKILRKAETEMPFASAPRYCAVHPTKPFFFENNETSNLVYAFRYDPKSGHLAKLCEVPVCIDVEGAASSDILVTPDGRYLLNCVRKANRIVSFAIDEETGVLTPIQELDTGECPRGVAVSPDGRFLLAAKVERNEVAVYAIGKDGRLTETSVKAQVANAANISVIEVS